MRRPAVVGIIALMLVVSCFMLVGMKSPDAESPRIITASGEATIAVDPDSARLFFQISTTAKTPTEARRENAKQVASVRNAILALKLPDVKTKTTDVSVMKIYGKAPNEDTPAPLVGFQVEHAFTILIKESSLVRLNAAVSRVHDTALEHGVDTTRDSVSFFKDDVRDLEQQAMSKAVENAIANAKAFAKGAEVKVVKVAAIYGDGQGAFQSSHSGQQGSFRTRSAEIAVSTSYLAGKTQITCRVRVACEF